MLSNDVRQGLFFGLHSGVITTAGLLFGIVQGNISIKYLFISVLSLAIADGSSEGYGMYLSKKAEKKDDKSLGPIYAGVSLGIIKFLTVLSFLLPLLLKKDIKIFKKPYWIYCWSLILLFIINYTISKLRDESFINHFIPHILVLFLVTQITKYLGEMIA
jgi:vacuolar iron transporter family protein